jgi:protein involved in temperature-dependent protein secretion
MPIHSGVYIYSHLYINYILFCWNSSVSKIIVFELIDNVLVRYQTEHKADQSLQITAELNAWSSTSTSLYAFVVLCLRISSSVLNGVLSNTNEVGRILEVWEWDYL